MSESKIYEAIKYLCNTNNASIANNAIAEVMHYLDHDEPEMAFEGLFIELMNNNNIIPKNTRDYYIKIAKELNLDKESVFRADFYDKFLKFMEV
jgi:transcription initiation factor TFIIIB Brf1 subunit/transcription initiation factor TFIIB